MEKKLVRIVIAILIIFGVLFAISFYQDYQFSQKSNFVAAEQLIVNSEQYHNKEICTIGWYSFGFEWSHLNVDSELIEVDTDTNYNVLSPHNLRKGLGGKALVCGVFQVRSISQTDSKIVHYRASGPDYKFRLTDRPNEPFP